MTAKVLVVEDEPFMREAYSTLLDWQGNGFSLVGFASNGEKAMEILGKTSVDIVITDLKMPRMSGIELIRACRAEFPNVVFIVVSGYDDFPLVKEAFSLGVKDYFLKYEIDADAILNVLLKAKNEIKEAQNSELQKKVDAEELLRLRELENIIGSSHYVLREKLLKELIWSQSNSAAIKDRIAKYGMTLIEHSLQVMVLTIQGYFDYEKEEWQGDRELLKYAFLNILEEICQKREQCYVFCNMPNEYVLIFSNIDEGNDRYPTALFEEIKAAIKECFLLDCCAGISNNTEKFNELKELYHEAKFACDYSYILGSEKVIAYNSVEKIGNSLQASEQILKLKTVLASLDAGKIKNVALELRVNPNTVGCGQISEIKNLFYLYYNEIEKFAKAENISEQIASELNAYAKAEKANSLIKMNKWLLELLQSVSDVFNGEHIIVKVKSYIKKHYKENITLKSAANMLQISESHLSRVFKKDQNESFSQYLLQTRMDEAVKLLKNTNMKIYEIAAEVGYSNPEQFSRMFKFVKGKSPKSYLKQ